VVVSTNLQNDASSVPVAIYVPPPILRGARHAPTSYVAVHAIDISDAITRLCRRFVPAWTAKAKKDGTRAVRSIACLDAGQQRSITRGVAQHGIAWRRARRLW
jgi:hypothetical protein